MLNLLLKILSLGLFKLAAPDPYLLIIMAFTIGQYPYFEMRQFALHRNVEKIERKLNKIERHLNIDIDET